MSIRAGDAQVTAVHATRIRSVPFRTGIDFRPQCTCGWGPGAARWLKRWGRTARRRAFGEALGMARRHERSTTGGNRP